MTQRAARAVELLEKELAGTPAGLPLAAPGGDASRYRQARDLEKALRDLQKALRELTKEEGRPPGKPGLKGREVRCVVRAVDPVARTLRLAVRDKDRELELTYYLAEGARVHAGPKEFSLSDLLPGCRIKVKLRDPTTVAEIKWEMDDD